MLPHGEYSYYKKWYNSNIKEEKSILFFGRIEDYKGLNYLIEAEPHISKSIPNVKIIIAGSGNITKYQNLIKNPKSFEIINKYIPDDGVAQLFQKSSIVVLPYVEASQSGIIPVAYAFKKPVVASNVGSIPELVENGKTGLLIPPCDPIELSNAIVKLLSDEDLRLEMGNNAYKKANEELSWDKIAIETMKIYKEVLNISK